MPLRRLSDMTQAERDALPRPIPDPPVRRLRMAVPPADKMTAAMVQDFARKAARHNVQVLLKNGLVIGPQGINHSLSDARALANIAPKTPDSENPLDAGIASRRDLS